MSYVWGFIPLPVCWAKDFPCDYRFLWIIGLVNWVKKCRVFFQVFRCSSSVAIVCVTLQFGMLYPTLLQQDVGEVSFLYIHSYCFLLFFCGVFKIITVFFLRHVLKDCLLLSSHSNGVGGVWPFVKIIVPLVVCEIILLKGIQCSFLFLHWSNWVHILCMGQYMFSITCISSSGSLDFSDTSHSGSDFILSIKTFWHWPLII